MFKPMLVTSGRLPPDSEKWSYEVKWDGFRALIEAAPSGIKIWSRNGHDMTSSYPELQALASGVRRPLVLDGEIVSLDSDGTPDFAALWFRSRGSSSPAVCFMAFDVLEVGGKDLIDEPYRERRRILEQLNISGPHWCTPEIHIGEGAALFDATKEMGLEGVVAKRLDSRYRPGLRSKSWTKTKHFQTRTFALLDGCRRRSGAATAVVWRWDSNRAMGSRSPASSSQATGGSSSSSSRRLLEVNFARCSNQVAYGKDLTRSSAR